MTLFYIEFFNFGENESCQTWESSRFSSLERANAYLEAFKADNAGFVPTKESMYGMHDPIVPGHYTWRNWSAFIAEE